MGATTVSVPDYTTLNNNDALKGTALQRFNQVTPYGTSVWQTDPNNPYSWAQINSLSAPQQNILNNQQNYSQGVGTLLNQNLNQFSQNGGLLGINESQLPKLDTNAGDTVYQSYMNRLQPQMDQQKGSFDQQMANQGLAPGSAAYDNASRNFNQGQNDLMLQGASNAANAQQGAYNTALNGQSTISNSRINQMNALSQGQQLQNPTFQAASGSTSPNSAAAAQATTAGNLGNANAQNAYSSNTTSGLFGLAGAALASKPWTW